MLKCCSHILWLWDFCVLLQCRCENTSVTSRLKIECLEIKNKNYLSLLSTAAVRKHSLNHSPHSCNQHSHTCWRGLACVASLIPLYYALQVTMSCLTSPIAQLESDSMLIQILGLVFMVTDKLWVLGDNNSGIKTMGGRVALKRKCEMFCTKTYPYWQQWEFATVVTPFKLKIWID